jgi:formyltetrahydrofolate synthetase
VPPRLVTDGRRQWWTSLPNGPQADEAAHRAGFRGLPIACQEQYSISYDHKPAGRPRAFESTVRNLKVSADRFLGPSTATHVHARLPRSRGGEIDVDENGKFSGLFKMEADKE